MSGGGFLSYEHPGIRDKPRRCLARFGFVSVVQEMTESREITIPLHYHSQDQYDIFHDPHRYVVLRSGRRYGKTVGAAVRNIEGAFAIAGSKQLWVDVRQSNISRYVAEEFLPRLAVEAKVKWSEQKKILTFPNKSIIVFVSAERPEGMEGFTYDRVTINEAGIILKARPKMWSSSILPMTMENKNVQIVIIGTPKSGSAQFKEFSDRGRDPEFKRWVEYHRTSYDNPMLTPEMITEVKDEIDDENLIPSEFYGEFPEEGGGYLVMTASSVEDAVERDMPLSEGYHVKWGVDVAGAGADQSALAKRHRNHLLEPIRTFDEKDTMIQAGMIAEEYDDTPDELKPSDIYVDANGLGKGMYDRLMELRLPARAVMVQSKPIDAKYFSLRDELWFAARAWFEEKTCSLPADRQLVRDLTVPMYDPAYGRGLTKVESKKEMKRRGARSPDRADAFCLTFAGGRDRLTKRLSSSSQKRKGHGWMAA